MVRQALTREVIGWACHLTECEEDGVLFVYSFDEENTVQESEGTLLCHTHFRHWMQGMVLEMTDDQPAVHHVIVSRP